MQEIIRCDYHIPQRTNQITNPELEILKMLPSEGTDFKMSTSGIVIWFVCLETLTLFDYFLPLPMNTVNKYRGEFRKGFIHLWRIVNLPIPHGDFSA